MVRFIHAFPQLEFDKLLQVYSLNGQQDDLWDHVLRSKAEDVYHCFYDLFTQKGAFAAVETAGEQYRAVLRAMPYRDGWLIAGLETAPELRNKGFAKTLVGETIKYIFSTGDRKVYSHVKKNNYASLKVHEACGFIKVNDTAVLLDGSVVSSHYTLCAKNS